MDYQSWDRQGIKCCHIKVLPLEIWVLNCCQWKFRHQIGLGLGGICESIAKFFKTCWGVIKKSVEYGDETWVKGDWHTSGEQRIEKLQLSWLNYLLLWSRGQGRMSTLYTTAGTLCPQIWSAACFCKWGFPETQLLSFIFVLPPAVFALEWQRGELQQKP